MSQAVYRVALFGPVFGDDVACLGRQLQEIVKTLYQVGVPQHWYYTDVETNNPSSFSGASGVHEIGGFGQLLAAASSVDQFQQGVFLASHVPEPRFRENPNTEDIEFANLGDADIEIRAFDTTYFDVYAADQNLLRRLSDKYGVDIEIWRDGME